MKSGNYIICNKCKKPNQLSELNCTNCSFILRDRVVNLDFLKIFISLVENPSKGFYHIVIAEHKNFITIFYSFFLLKMFLINLSLMNILGKDIQSKINHLLYFTIILLSVTILLALILKSILKLGEIRIRLKDYFAIISFSTFPFIFSFLLLTILEIAVFGDYLFEVSPSPFEIRPFLAYIFLILEIIIILWTFILFVISMHTLIKNKFLSFIFGIFNFCIILVVPHIIIIKLLF